MDRVATKVAIEIAMHFEQFNSDTAPREQETRNDPSRPPSNEDALGLLRHASAIVEEVMVQPNKRTLARCLGTFDGVGRQMIDRTGRPDALRDIAAAVMRLQKQASRIAAQR